MPGSRRVHNLALLHNKGTAMKAIAQIPYVPPVYAVGGSTYFTVGKLVVPLTFAMAVALGATLTSLGMAMYTGWQSGGLLIERIMRVLLVGVAVLFVHCLPMGWSAFRGLAQFAAFALWAIAATVVLYAQVTFFMISQQHAGDLRAAAVPAPSVPISSTLLLVRSRVEIAKEAAKVNVDLARAQAQHCVGDCPTLKVRRVRLAAEIMALNTEAEEAKRREASEDRRNLQTDRVDQLRATVRADPVAFPVASWFGTTEHCLELIIGLAYAVVLEGAAILGWTLVSVALRRDAGRRSTASDHPCGASEHDFPIQMDSSRAVLSEDDQLLERIHAAVVAGELKPTQDSIRKFLRCGQPKAGKLNRHYLARFGSVHG